MSEAAKKLVDAFDALPPDERRNVVREILRRAVLFYHDFPSDEELIIAADDIFSDLDSHETLE
jgi:hypothetical protein